MNRGTLGKFLASLALFCFVSISILLLSPNEYPGNQFVKYPLPLQTYDLHDLGLVDIEGNGYLDIYTTNHSARQNLFINQGDGTFFESLEFKGLSQDKLFPGLEVSNEHLTESEPGLYIYRKGRFRWNKNNPDNTLVISARNLDKIGLSNPLEGQIKILSRVSVKRAQDVSIVYEEEQLSNNVTNSSVKFSFDRGGRLEITSDLTALPCSIQLDKSIPLNHVYVGFNRVNPENHSIELLWKDRHGMAWADYDLDSDLDVFISRGGLKGKLEEIRDLSANQDIFDELYATQSTTMEDVIEKSGIEKRNCPGRQTAWNDFDRDGLLDLYIVCGRGSPPLSESPNLLYKQLENHSFKEIAKEVGLAHPKIGAFKWIDINNDGYDDFLWATTNAIEIYTNRENSFVKEWSVPTQMKNASSISLSDFDSDGDIDAFVLGTPLNIVLVNEGNHFVNVNPIDLGLPNTASTAQWVDFDNDGLTDLFSIPGGIYKQQENGLFESISILNNKIGLTQISAARCIWFDIDNNGYLDLVTAINYKPWWARLLSKLLSQDVPATREWDIKAYRNNLAMNNNWLKIDLLDSKGGHDVIGTTVLIDNGNSAQKHLVGEADGSRYSQGQYRIYQGLGVSNEIPIIDITWPDGTTQSLYDIEANQQLVVRQSPVGE